MADGDFVSMVENVDHEIEPGVRVKMETHEPGGDNHSEHNGASSSEPAKEHNPSTGPRLSDLRIGVEEKSHMLTSAWTELSNILGQYKAELYSRDDSTQKYEHTNDVCLLKSELVDKDSEIAHLRMQLGEVQNQCEQIQRHNEQCQMDLSVKDSLLKKYQDDLLQKEAALMTSQTKISRLENRLRMLESRAGAQVERKVVKPVGSPRMSPLARLSRGGLVTRPMLGRMMPGLSPARKRPSLPITPIRSPSASRSTPAKQETQPVVCIEVDDDEIRQEVDLVSQQSLQQEASIGLYGGELYDSATTEATDVGSLPGTSEPQPGTSSASPRQDMLNRPMMVQEEYVGDQDTSLKPQDWPEAYERQQVPAQMQQPQTTNKMFAENVTSKQKRALAEYMERSEPRDASVEEKLSKRAQCRICQKTFAHAKSIPKHIQSVHERKVKFGWKCATCGATFATKWSFVDHSTHIHPPREGSTCMPDIHVVPAEVKRKQENASPPIGVGWNASDYSGDKLMEVIDEIEDLEVGTNVEKSGDNVLVEDLIMEVQAASDVVDTTRRNRETAVDVEVPRTRDVTTTVILNCKQDESYSSQKREIDGPKPIIDPMQCPICKKTFNRADYALTHRREVHDGDYNYHECSVCRAKFTRKSALNRHIGRRHKTLTTSREQLSKRASLCTHSSARSFPNAIDEPRMNRFDEPNEKPTSSHSLEPKDLSHSSGKKPNPTTPHNDGRRVHSSQNALYECTICSGTYRDQQQFRRHLTEHQLDSYKDWSTFCIVIKTID